MGTFRAQGFVFVDVPFCSFDDTGYPTSFLLLGAFIFGWEYEAFAGGIKFPKHFFAR
jgi:hypothetical protein